MAIDIRAKCPDGYPARSGLMYGLRQFDVVFLFVIVGANTSQHKALL